TAPAEAKPSDPNSASQSSNTPAEQDGSVVNAAGGGEWRVREEAADGKDSMSSSTIEAVRYDQVTTGNATSDSGQLPAGEPATAAPPSAAATPADATSTQAPAGATASATQPAPLNSASQADAGARTAATSTEGGKGATRSFATQLNNLEIQLSRRVAGPPNLLVFEDLEQEGARLASI